MTYNRNILALIVLFIVSCDKKQLSDNLDNNDQSTDPIVLFERESREPVILSRKSYQVDVLKTRSTISSAVDPNITVSPFYILGRCYSVEDNGISGPEKIKYPVINIEKLYADHPDYFKKINIRSTDSRSFSFTKFDKYVEKSKSNTVVNKGFGLKLGVFSIGAKKKFSETFSTNTVNETNRVFGEVDVLVKDASYSLLLTDNVVNKIKESYLAPIFVDELYNNSIYNFARQFGTFVISDYISGGKMNAIFSGINSSSQSESSKERGMEVSINAGVSFNKETGGGSASGNLSVGNTNGNSIANTNNVSAHPVLEGKEFLQIIAGGQKFVKATLGTTFMGLGYFVASSGNITDEVIMEYIKSKILSKRMMILRFPHEGELVSRL